MTTLLDAFKQGLKNYSLLLIVLVFSVTYLFCFKYFYSTCVDEFSFKNLAAFVLVLATISHIIPTHWYQNVGNLIKVFGSFFHNEEEKGLFDKVINSKPTLICLTVFLTILVLCITALLMTQPGLVQKIVNM